ncbi:hypothetical protein AALP_AA1G053300 [Arabis alpina]|uniref:Pentacotripeptide-repeat region of PRORP domain-containing protein n=1 Tax=Arabis alpina TaxID=50452 RepID=A0A087HLA0_ARAAL|nr:hypothetical protein AALP_AA1G053300 [Arabis alpina]
MKRGTIKLFTLVSLRDTLKASRLSFSTLTDTRPFPDYSPKKASVRDTELVQQITNVIKLRRVEPLKRSLKLYECKFKTDHLIWVLMKIKFDYWEFPEVGVCWNVASYNIVIHCVCQLGRINEAHRLLLLMELKGYVPDVISYSTVINGYCRFGEFDKVWKVIEEMKQKGLNPNSYTYGSIILLLCRTSKLAEAEDAFREMIRQGIVPDTVVYTTLIDGFCKRGDIRAASKFFYEMHSLGEMAKAQEILKEMLGKGLQPTVVTFNVLMNGFCLNGMLEDGEKLLNWMLAKGIAPNATTYNSLVKQYCIRDNLKAATAIYKDMCAREVGRPDGKTYENLIRGHCKARNMKEAWFLFREMKEKGFSVSTSTYSVLIKGFFKRKKFAEAREVFDQMRREGLAADKEIFDFFNDTKYKGRKADTIVDPVDEIIESYLVDEELREAN